MAEFLFYFDSKAPAGGDGTESLPYNSVLSINWTTGGANSVFDLVAAGNDVKVKLKCGSEFKEQMFTGASGTADHPIEIMSYSFGDKPIINGEQIRIPFANADKSYIIIHDLVLENGLEDCLKLTGISAEGIVTHNVELRGSTDQGLQHTAGSGAFPKSVHHNLHSHHNNDDGISLHNGTATVYGADLHDNGGDDIVTNGNGIGVVGSTFTGDNIRIHGGSKCGEAILADSAASVTITDLQIYDYDCTTKGQSLITNKNGSTVTINGYSIRDSAAGISIARNTIGAGGPIVLDTGTISNVHCGNVAFLLKNPGDKIKRSSIDMSGFTDNVMQLFDENIEVEVCLFHGTSSAMAASKRIIYGNDVIPKINNIVIKDFQHAEAAFLFGTSVNVSKELSNIILKNGVAGVYTWNGAGETATITCKNWCIDDVTSDTKEYGDGAKVVTFPNLVSADPQISATGKLAKASPCNNTGTITPGVNDGLQTDIFDRMNYGPQSIGVDWAAGMPTTGQNRGSNLGKAAFR